jgi:hypothetical protein
MQQTCVDKTVFIDLCYKVFTAIGNLQIFLKVKKVTEVLKAPNKVKYILHF